VPQQSKLQAIGDHRPDLATRVITVVHEQSDVHRMFTRVLSSHIHQAGGRHDPFDRQDHGATHEAFQLLDSLARGS
jgi:hypothetical protein